VAEHQGRFPGPRGLVIHHQAWLPDGAPKGLVLVVHGLGEHIGRYGNLIEALRPRGYAVFGLDHIGHGRSDGPRADALAFSDFTAPLGTLRALASERFPTTPTFLLGHSLGGLIAAHYLLDHQAGLAGAVLSAPAVVPGSSVTPLTIIVGRLLARLAPTVGVLALDVTALSRDPQVVQAYRDDPLVFHGKTNARLGSLVLAAMARVQRDAATIRLPLLLVQGGADRLTDPAGAELLHERLGSRDVTLERYPHAYHELFNEPDREHVLVRVVDWLDARVDALRSPRHGEERSATT